MLRFQPVPEPSIIPAAIETRSADPAPKTTPMTSLDVLDVSTGTSTTFTGVIGAMCMLPLRAIIRTCVALRIHPEHSDAHRRHHQRRRGGGARLRTVPPSLRHHARRQHLRFHRDGKVAHQLQLQSPFGAFWDSTLDRFSDLALLTGLIFLYSKIGSSDYVLVAALALIFSIMTSYARARAESLKVPKCKVGFLERPERIVLFMIGASTNRMAAVLWVILTLSILAVANRIYYTYLALNELPMPSKEGVKGLSQPRVLLRTDERETPCLYDLWVIAILAFVWLTPPQWLADPMFSLIPNP